MGIAVFPAAGGGVTQKVQEFTSTGTFTVPSNCSTVEVFLVGGGGAGGGDFDDNAGSMHAGGGGGGGGVITRVLTVTPGQTYTVTIGAGGAGNNANSGSNGSNTTFGSLATAFGGGGGGAAHNNTPTPSTVRAGKDGASGGGGGATWGNSATSFVYAGAGGGAGGNANFVPYISGGVTVEPWNIFSIPGNGIYGGGNGCHGFQGNRQGIIQAGPGVNGYGAGGRGGISLPISPDYSGWVVGFGATGVTRVGGTGSTAGTAATANTGNGGGGSAGIGSASAAGGAGGSGYARVTFWS